MIVDSLNLVVEDNGSGGDSAHYTGLATIASHSQYFGLKYLVGIDGLAVRHPTQHPWNNPWNFTRDQLMPLIGGLYAQGRTDKIRALFWSHAKRLFFCQNFERDVPGSKKYPWPHTFINFKGEKETRSFDFADPLLPHDIYAFARAGKFWFAPLLYPFGFASLILHLFLTRRSGRTDIGTTIAVCYLAGVLPYFRLIVPDYANRLKEYFLGWRKMGVLCELLIHYIENAPLGFSGLASTTGSRTRSYPTLDLQRITLASEETSIES